MNIKIITANKAEAASYLPDVAGLRISVFKEYPYLYEGDFAYEQKYLQRYLESASAALLLAFDGANIIGASTANALADEMNSIQEPFLNAGHNLADYYYFAESVLLPQYRGRGIGKEFMQKRIDIAKQHGKKYATFCAVDRSKTHVVPASYQSPEYLWQKFGFEKQPNLISYFSWRDVGDKVETKKPLVYWLKQL